MVVRDGVLGLRTRTSGQNPRFPHPQTRRGGRLVPHKSVPARSLLGGDARNPMTRMAAPPGLGRPATAGFGMGSVGGGGSVGPFAALPGPDDQLRLREEIETGCLGSTRSIFAPVLALPAWGEDAVPDLIATGS